MKLTMDKSQALAKIAELQEYIQESDVVFPKYLRYTGPGGDFIVEVDSYKDCSGTIVWSENEHSRAGSISDKFSWDCLDKYWVEVSEIPAEQERTCGLTEAEWDVVIKGEFLCQFADEQSKWDETWAGKLTNTKITPGKLYAFSQDDTHYVYCRPLRAVGIEQPYLDSEECREYLDSLSDDAVIVRHHTAQAQWCEVGVMKLKRKATGPGIIARGRMGVWHNVYPWDAHDKFVVLDDGR